MDIALKQRMSATCCCRLHGQECARTHYPHSVCHCSLCASLRFLGARLLRSLWHTELACRTARLTSGQASQLYLSFVLTKAVAAHMHCIAAARLNRAKQPQHPVSVLARTCTSEPEALPQTCAFRANPTTCSSVGSAGLACTDRSCEPMAGSSRCG